MLGRHAAVFRGGASLMAGARQRRERGGQCSLRRTAAFGESNLKGVSLDAPKPWN